MTVEIQDLLARQAAWQRERATRPWSEKLRAAIAMRATMRSLRRSLPQPPTADAPPRHPALAQPTGRCVVQHVHKDAPRNPGAATGVSPCE